MRQLEQRVAEGPERRACAGAPDRPRLGGAADTGSFRTEAGKLINPPAEQLLDRFLEHALPLTKIGDQRQ
ncbi:MAG: hypothetical protein HY744_08550 [Deltaproteobacteria bacterium]|nr:hypothetical protein [Deltaproteobacteria bacterium]